MATLSLKVSVKTARRINILYTFDIFSGVIYIYKFIVCSFMFGTKVHKTDRHFTITTWLLIFIHFSYFIADYNNDTLNTSSTMNDKGKS